MTNANTAYDISLRFYQLTVGRGPLPFVLGVVLCSLSGAIVHAQAPAELSSAVPLYRPAASFNATDKIVSATVFHWFGELDGQQIGPWRPLEGRPAWDGSVDFWKRQIKDIMDANIQVMFCHLMGDPAHEQRHVNLFQAAGELRAQGYNVPKIAPFFDVPLTFIPQFGYTSPVDLNTAAGKDTFVDQYKRFYNQYYSVNTDAYADDYLYRIDNKPVLDVWHLLPENVANRTSLTRADVESRLSAAFGAEHPMFNNGVYQVATALNPGIQMPFANERIPQFEVNDYLRTYRPNVSTPRTAQIKPGVWDQNLEDREPGVFKARDGGTNYTNAWNTANATSNLRRINVESWNEYDEGTGIYDAGTGPPYISQYNTSGNTDTWSNTNNPRQYIDTTAAGARTFNSIPDHGAQILWHNLPSQMNAGQEGDFQVIVRNEGDLSWTEAQLFRFGQQVFPGEVLFGPGRYLLDDTTNEIPKYGGIFRGRPVTFNVHLVAPDAPGSYLTHWSMLQENVVWFGELLSLTIKVNPQGDYNADGVVDAADYVVWRNMLGQTGTGLAADGDGSRTIDAGDYNVWRVHFGQTAGSGSGASANATVPEPAAAVLLMLTMIGWCLWRCR